MEFYCFILFPPFKRTFHARTQTFEKEGGGANLRVFNKGGCESQENSDFEAKIRGVTSVSGEKLNNCSHRR